MEKENRQVHECQKSDEQQQQILEPKLKTRDETSEGASEIIEPGKGDESSGSINDTNRDSKSSQQQQQQQQQKAKITHRSQSSPSSLTTHKFGLRPTPSPPRLIIDHNTGDIVEHYPEQPVYLRTYQPLDDDTIDEPALDDSLAHPYPPPLDNQRQLEEYQQLLEEHYGQKERQRQQQVQGSQMGSSDQYISSDELASMSQQGRNSFRPVIPPPHSASGRVYFANQPNQDAGHLFHGHGQRQHHQQQPLDVYREQLERQANASTSGQQPVLSGAHSQSFKRALNKLDEIEGKTDIALVADADERVGCKGEPKLKITTTSKACNNNLQAGQGNNKQPRGKGSKASAQKHGRGKESKIQTHGAISGGQIEPAIEDFNLYDLCYNFRILLVVLLSSLIIYLLIVPLNLDCTLYRPTYTYVSIIVASVNLTSIVIFSLFWFCSGVTRTLYANLSSSAFIITIYSILVAINLALAVLFFFINTCHFQKLINTQASPIPGSLIEPAGQQQQQQQEQNLPLALLRGGEQELLEILGPRIKIQSSLEGAGETPEGLERARRHSMAGGVGFSRMFEVNNGNQLSDSDGWFMSIMSLGRLAGPAVSGRLQHERREEFTLRSKRQSEENEPDQRPLDSERRLQDSGGLMTVADDDLSRDEGTSGHTTYAQSPFDYAWERTKEQAMLFRRSFYKFLINYDLNFIGAIHALCAVCLQYMAMKVAVVRSYFCSPVGLYI